MTPPWSSPDTADEREILRLIEAAYNDGRSQYLIADGSSQLWNEKMDAYLAALRALAATPTSEPVAWRYRYSIGKGEFFTEISRNPPDFQVDELTPLYAAPPCFDNSADREKIARIIAGCIHCDEECQNNPGGCGCSLDAADAIIALSRPHQPATEKTSEGQS